ncbi:MAG: type IIL restriction-modification enzyme MmeI [Gemmatimonadales bacterium]
MAERWDGSTLGEKQAFQTWFIEFCDALGVERPAPDGGGTYCFELPVKVITPDGGNTTNFIDCWKAGHVAIEAKASGKGSNEVLLRKAYRQLTNYVAAEPGTIPPYLMVVDVARELIIWDAWSGRFGGFAIGERVRLGRLADRPDLVALLQDVFTNPSARDPRGRAQQVTKEIAGKLAQLAATFEGRGHPPERVARFLMRCVFCFFAEDVGLLPRKLFERTLESALSAGGAARVAGVLTSLWKTMDTGGDFGADLIDRFNGHFFQSIESLPLEAADVQLLIEAAGFDWSAVEPSIFGTLLVRALDPVERHKLGAEYTPREYIERLVEPTVLEPLRARWSAVEARVKQLEEEDSGRGASRNRLSTKQREALKEVQEYHAWLRGLSFLDPACGSGNFLYVTMAAVKELELEVIREIERLGAREGTEQTEQILDEVHPRQFHGIEVSWWAREIAELTLWIGYHQFWRRAHGGRTPPIPILEDTGTIECRDAILAWDEEIPVPGKDEPDLTPRILDPVSGVLVPDPDARIPYVKKMNPRQAEWPQADFIIGNPPYIGGTSMRGALGSGYVDALRDVYPEAEFEGADFVMFWWARAAGEVDAGRSLRAGLITTNSITQSRNRRVAQLAMGENAQVVWAIRDHPWVDEADGAAVRVAMTVLAKPGPAGVTLVAAPDGLPTHLTRGERFNSDLTLHANVAAAASVGLLANEGLSSNGYNLRGSGFILEREEAERLLSHDASLTAVVRPYLNGRDLARQSRDAFLIDFNEATEEEARQFPVLFDLLRTRVYPERRVKKEAAARTYWWRLWRTRPDFRAAMAGQNHFIATPETSKHRFFVRLPARTAPDHGLVVVAAADPEVMGVLSSATHLSWALRAGSRLGVGNDPRYNKSRCFDPFPFPDPTQAVKEQIRALAERLDQHRKDALARDESVTMTGMYNVVEKFRSGEELSPKERKIHEIAACGVLKDLHDELDALVAEAYGWPWPMEREEILERLVALHDERVEEEKRGLIRWLRPDYQIPRFAPEHAPAEELDLGEEDGSEPDSSEAEKQPWPATAVEQLEAITTLAGRGLTTLDELVAAFEGANTKLVARHLETLEMLGEVRGAAVAGERPRGRKH